MSLSIVSNGSPVAIGGVKLSVASSTVNLTNCRFYNDRGGRLYGRASEAAVTLVVTTTPTSIADLYFTATGQKWNERFGLDALGMAADAPSAVVNVYLSGNTDSVDYTAPTSKIFVCGQLPQEVWSYGAGVGAGSAGDSVEVWKTGTVATGTLTNTNDYIEGSCVGMAGIILEATAVSTTGPNIQVDCYINGQWRQAELAYRSVTGSAWSFIVNYPALTTSAVIWVKVIPGATLFRIVMYGGATGPHTIVATPSAQPWNPAAVLNGGRMDIPGSSSQDTAAPSSLTVVGAEGRSTDGTAVTSGRSARLLSTLLAKLVTMPYALPGQSWSAATAQITTTNETTLKAAGGAGIRTYLTSLAIVNTGGATASGAHVTVLDGSGGTVLWAGGIDRDYVFPVPLRGSANTALIVKCSAAGDVRVSGAGFTAAE